MQCNVSKLYAEVHICIIYFTDICTIDMIDLGFFSRKFVIPKKGSRNIY